MDVQTAYLHRVRRPIVQVVCAECTDHRRVLGRVHDSPVGPLLARAAERTDRKATVRRIANERGREIEWPTTVIDLGRTDRTIIVFECRGHRREATIDELTAAVERVRRSSDPMRCETIAL